MLPGLSQKAKFKNSFCSTSLSTKCPSLIFQK